MEPPNESMANLSLVPFLLGMMTENDYTHPWKYPDFLDALPIIIHGAVGPLKKIYLTRTYVYIIYSYVYVVYI